LAIPIAANDAVGMLLSISAAANHAGSCCR
jgi:hypothetical protein